MDSITSSYSVNCSTQHGAIKLVEGTQIPPLMLLIKPLKCTSPKMDPWRTPLMTGLQLGTQPWTTTPLSVSMGHFHPPVPSVHHRKLTDGSGKSSEMTRQTYRSCHEGLLKHTQESDTVCSSRIFCASKFIIFYILSEYLQNSCTGLYFCTGFITCKIQKFSPFSAGNLKKSL